MTRRTKLLSREDTVQGSLSLHILSRRGVTLSSYGNFLDVDLPAFPACPDGVSMRWSRRCISVSGEETEAQKG